MNNGFTTPPNHRNFKAKKIFANIGEITDGAMAYIEVNGGGPIEPHTHSHNHLFIIIEGEAILLLNKDKITLKKGETFLVDGNLPHSLWNSSNKQTKVIGITLK